MKLFFILLTFYSVCSFGTIIRPTSYKAIQKGDIVKVKELFEKGHFKANKTYWHGRITPLHLATKSGHIEVKEKNHDNTTTCIITIK